MVNVRDSSKVTACSGGKGRIPADVQSVEAAKTKEESGCSSTPDETKSWYSLMMNHSLHKKPGVSTVASTGKGGNRWRNIGAPTGRQPWPNSQSAPPKNEEQ
jgi:hypothetical protein